MSCYLAHLFIGELSSINAFEAENVRVEIFAKKIENRVFFYFQPSFELGRYDLFRKLFNEVPSLQGSCISDDSLLVKR